MIGVISRYWHTVRFLKPIQIYGRIRFRLVRPTIDPRDRAPIRRTPSQLWTRSPERRQSMVGPDTFCFLNETGYLEDGWDSAKYEKLWRYNLHYFDDLNAIGASSRAEWHRALLSRWVQENPPGHGSGWEPYPTSLRIVNWIKWTLAGNSLPPECSESLAAQARWLSKRLETHILGNHLFANAKALIFAGAYHEGPEAEHWLECGCRILDAQLPEQVLADGGHFELSPMYHALALEDVLDLCNIDATYADALPTQWSMAPATWRSTASRMAGWLMAMTHPDGDIAFFNDAAFGIAARPAALLEYASRLGIEPPLPSGKELKVMGSTGYVRAAVGDIVAILDVARVGPDYLPAHAHADSLSFECSLFGHRLFVNSGTSVYGNSSERQRQRGTAAHNTVVIDDRDSSEVWGGFRVARRARPERVEVREGPDVIVRAAHDGYRCLAGKPTPSRQWSVTARGVEITDAIDGRFETAVAHFHLHPAVRVGAMRTSDAGAEIQLDLPNGRSVMFFVGSRGVRVVRSTWHPEFGRSVENRCIIGTFERATLRSALRWA